MEHISDLFGRERVFKGGKPLSERASLVEYFSGEFSRDPKVVAIRLSHYTLSDLYGLQSAYKDRLNRNGREAAIKYLWVVTRTTRI